MKKIINKSALLPIIILAHLLINTSIFAQAPQKMSYQAVLRNTTGALVSSTSVGMQISILQGTATGTAVYTETQNASTNVNGLVSLEIGVGTVVSGTFAGINWANGPYFIQTETDPLGGTNYSITGSNQLMSVPYALFSANGTPGPEGDQGPAGNDGATGPQGIAGTNGNDGATGPQGIAGTNGNDGATGPQGIAGTNGNDGATGLAGTFPPGTVAGEMNYWNGTSWVTVAPGSSNQNLTFCNGVPTWGPCNATIGQSYLGGIVAYILQAGDAGYEINVQHGLIVAPSDQGYASWGCYGTVISGADGTAIGTGAQNTIDIMNGCSSSGIAARLCGDLVLGGYSDWYLPSKDELNQLYINRVAIGGFAYYALYWSSTEGNSFDAWRQYFGNGNQGDNFLKDSYEVVRAVRAF
jgi:hypothetical protein